MKITRTALILLLGILLISGLACGGEVVSASTLTTTPDSTEKELPIGETVVVGILFFIFFTFVISFIISMVYRIKPLRKYWLVRRIGGPVARFIDRHPLPPPPG